MGIYVRKLSESFVRPSRPTPSGRLPLSWQDKLPSSNGMVENLMVYKYGMNPAKILREALSKALVLYYPIAGVFVESEDGELLVDCTGRGVWFVEAAADCTLEDVNFLEYPLQIPKEQIFPQPSAAMDSKYLITMIQVTTFVCGGFVIGTSSSHIITDGMGMSQFLKAIAEIARGHENPTVIPVWCRDILPKHVMLSHDHHHRTRAPMRSCNLDLTFAAIDVPLSQVNRLKLKFTEELGRRCSTFDILTAMAWQSRTRAMNLPAMANVHLVFPMDIRHLMKDVLPKEGYYGNCIHVISVTNTSKKIAEGELIDVIKLIKAAKENLSLEFHRWMKGDSAIMIDLISFENTYEAFFVTDWSRIGTDDHDYGWGEPVSIYPQFEGRNYCLIVKSPEKRFGRLVTRCVKQEHLKSFISNFNDYYCPTTVHA